MSDNPFPTLGPSDSGLLDAPKTPAYIGGRPRIERSDRDGEPMSEPVPVASVDIDRLEASLRDAPLPDGLLGRLHGVVDEF